MHQLHQRVKETISQKALLNSVSEGWGVGGVVFSVCCVAVYQLVSWVSIPVRVLISQKPGNNSSMLARTTQRDVFGMPFPSLP